MESQRLELLLKEIQTCIDDFKKELAGSADYYQETLKVITDNKLRSLLMEQHVTHIEGQRAALAKMEALYEGVQNQLVQNQLAGLNKSN